MHQQQLLQAKQAQEQQLAEQQQAKLAQQQAMANNTVQEKPSADAVSSVPSTVEAPTSVGPAVGPTAQTAANGKPAAPAKLSLANRICK